MTQGSWLTSQGSWLKAHCQENIGAGSPKPGPWRQIFLGHEPQALNHEPWGISHEPWTINNRFINELFDSILYFRSFKITKLQASKISRFPSFDISSFKFSKFQDSKILRCKDSKIPKRFRIKELTNSQDSKIPEFRKFKIPKFLISQNAFAETDSGKCLFHIIRYIRTHK